MAGAITTLFLFTQDPHFSAGTGYLANDTGAIHQGANVTGTFHVVSVDGSGGITGITVDHGGAGYVCQYPVTLVAAGAQPLHGSGAKIGIFASTPGFAPGAITEYQGTDQGSGSGYANGDTGTILGGNHDATYIAFNGDVLSVFIAFAGTGYAPGNYSTAIGGSQPGSGSGLVVEIDGVLNSGGSGSGYLNHIFGG